MLSLEVNFEPFKNLFSSKFVANFIAFWRRSWLLMIENFCYCFPKQMVKNLISAIKLNIFYFTCQYFMQILHWKSFKRQLKDFVFKNAQNWAFWINKLHFEFSNELAIFILRCLQQPTKHFVSTHIHFFVFDFFIMNTSESRSLIRLPLSTSSTIGRFITKLILRFPPLHRAERRNYRFSVL